MQQQQIDQTLGRTGPERQRIEAVVETLANLHSKSETLAELAHDARNMVTALGLYCDLLEEPGVLASPFAHYGNELRLVAAASRRLVEKLAELDCRQAMESGHGTAPVWVSDRESVWESDREAGRESNRDSELENGIFDPVPGLPASNLRSQTQRNRLWDLMPAEPIDNLAAELAANRNLLSSLAGPAIALTVDTDAGALPVRITGEDLTRVLINLIKNAAEALPAGGRILIGLREHRDTPDSGVLLILTIEDNGPGIPEEALEKIFTSGYTKPAAGASPGTGWRSTHRGLGLAITRSIVAAAGGRISAVNRAQGGARFEIQLPARM